MADYTVFSYSRCSTCRKALTWLESQGLSCEVVDITLQPPSLDWLSEAADQFDSLKPLFNTSGQSYRALGAATVKAMTRDQALQALASDGKLIKRPFLRGPDGRYLTGFKPEVWEAELLG